MNIRQKIWTSELQIRYREHAYRSKYAILSIEQITVCLSHVFSLIKLYKYWIIIIRDYYYNTIDWYINIYVVNHIIRLNTNYLILKNNCLGWMTIHHNVKKHLWNQLIETGMELIPQSARHHTTMIYPEFLKQPFHLGQSIVLESQKFWYIKISVTFSSYSGWDKVYIR